MLTNIFYYSYYKPYMIRSVDENNSVVSGRRPKISSSGYDDMKNKYIILNKALKADIVNYASGVSSKMINIKEGAKNVIQDMEDFNKNLRANSPEDAKKWIADDIEQLVGSYNESSNFFASQKHSPALSYFSMGLTDDLRFNSDRLEQLGVTMDENGKLSFDRKVFDGLDIHNMDTVIGESLHIFQSIYDSSSEMMTLPLSEHMSFKGLNYHYNYKLGTVVSDSFKLIESGMLVDIAV